MITLSAALQAAANGSIAVTTRAVVVLAVTRRLIHIVVLSSTAMDRTPAIRGTELGTNRGVAAAPQPFSPHLREATVARQRNGRWFYSERRSVC